MHIVAIVCLSFGWVWFFKSNNWLHTAIALCSNSLWGTTWKYFTNYCNSWPVSIMHTSYQWAVSSDSTVCIRVCIYSDCRPAHHSTGSCEVRTQQMCGMSVTSDQTWSSCSEQCKSRIVAPISCPHVRTYITMHPWHTSQYYSIYNITQ